MFPPLSSQILGHIHVFWSVVLSSFLTIDLGIPFFIALCVASIIAMMAMYGLDMRKWVEKCLPSKNK